MRFIVSALLAVAASLGSVQPAQAWQQPWDWCSTVTITSRSTKAVASLNITGTCDGGKLRMVGSMVRRGGSFSLRGTLGGSRITLSGFAGQYTEMTGYIDTVQVEVQGSGNKYSCDLDGSFDSEYESLQPGSLFGRICPTLIGLRR